MFSQRKRYAVLIVAFLIASLLIIMLYMASQQDPVPNKDAFISTWDTWKTSSGSSYIDQVRLPLVEDGDYDFIVDWGDDNQNRITVWNQEETTHTYAREGVYTTTITGMIEGWRFGSHGDSLKLMEISQWGTLKLGNSGGYFQGTKNLKITAEDKLDLSGTTSMRYAFNGSGIDTVPGMNDWDVSNITDMGGMFIGASSFNQDIGGWDVGNITDMRVMFYGARFFNQEIGGWDVSNVTNMEGMFKYATVFDQDISNWNVGNVTDMSAMFYGVESFNREIDRWDVSNVVNMSEMFAMAVSFDKEIGEWDVSNVKDMSLMFGGARSFNQDISGWDVSNVNNMRRLFSVANSFNQDISGWDVSNVKDMSLMFGGASSFNQDIGGWDVSNVKDMSRMFYLAMSFNHDISGWDIGNVTTMEGMFESASLSTENYDSLLIGWAQLLQLQRDIVFHAGNSRYSDKAADARAALINDYNWTITDGGKAE